ETALLKAVAEAFPGVVTVRVRDALDAAGRVVSNLALAMRGASALTLLMAVLVLGGALAASHRQRVYDAVILKTVGATRMRLLSAYALEYLTLGVTTAVFGVAAGSAAAAFVVLRVMKVPFVWGAGPPFAGAALGGATRRLRCGAWLRRCRLRRPQGDEASIRLGARAALCRRRHRGCRDGDNWSHRYVQGARPETGPRLSQPIGRIHPRAQNTQARANGSAREVWLARKRAECPAISDNTPRPTSASQRR